MLSVSYAAAAAACSPRALTSSSDWSVFNDDTMLIGSLLLIYGPAFLSYTFIRRVIFLDPSIVRLSCVPHPIFPIIQADFRTLMQSSCDEIFQLH